MQLRQCLSEDSYFKLLEFLTRDDPRIVDCRALGCEERVFCDEGDDFADLACPKGHRFCAKCDSGPHPLLSCSARRSQLEQEQELTTEVSYINLHLKVFPIWCQRITAVLIPPFLMSESVSPGEI